MGKNYEAFNKKISFILTYLAPLIVITLSVYIHGVLREYSDIYSITLDRSRGDTIYGIPYKDFKFEYPPFIGFMWGLSSVVTRLIMSFLQSYDPAIIHIYVLFFINAFFYILYVSSIEALIKEFFNITSSSMKYFLSIGSFSMTYYLMYNWDIIALSLAMWSLVYLFRRRYYASSLLLGLSVLSKLFTGIFIISYIYYIHRVEKDKAYHKAPATLLIFIGTILVGFSIFMLLFPKAFQDFVSHHATWYCENCFYILLTDDIWDPLWRSVSQALMIVLPLLVSIHILSREVGNDTYVVMRCSLISIAALISVSYVYSPQMNILITPLFLITGFVDMIIMLVSDFLNMMIMILWFRSDLLSSFLGIQYSDPHFRTSPIQWIAFTRITLLWIVIILLLRRKR